MSSRKIILNSIGLTLIMVGAGLFGAAALLSNISALATNLFMQLSSSGTVIETGSGEVVLNYDVHNELLFEDIESLYEGISSYSSSGSLLSGSGYTVLTDSGALLTLLREFYGTQQGSVLAEGILGEAQGIWDQFISALSAVDDGYSEYAIQSAIINNARNRVKIEMNTYNYRTLSNEDLYNPLFAQENQFRLEQRRQDNVQMRVYQLEGEGIPQFLEFDNFYLDPYTEVKEDDVPYIGVRALGELRTILQLREEEVSFYSSEEAALQDFTGASIALKKVFEHTNTWTLYYNIYMRGIPVKNAFIILEIGKDGLLHNVRSSFPSVASYPEPGESIPYAEIENSLRVSFNELDITSFVFLENLWCYRAEDNSVHSVLLVEFESASPYGKWQAYVDKETGDVHGYQSLLQYFEEEPKGVPHQVFAPFVQESPQDSPVYHYVPHSVVTYYPSGNDYYTNSEGVHYPNGEQSRYFFENQWLSVFEENKQTRVNAERDYLEGVSTMINSLAPESGTGATMIEDGEEIIDALWNALASTISEEAIGIVHKHYWEPTEASLHTSNIYIHGTQFLEYFVDVLSITDFEKVTVINNSESVLENREGCGAWYDSETKEVHFGTGGCGEYSYGLSKDLIIHEITHALVDQWYFIPGNASFDESSAMREAVSDYYAAAFSNDPIIGEYTLYQPRTLENSLQYIHYDQYGNITGTDWSLDMHKNSMIISGILWDLRSTLGSLSFDKELIHIIKMQPSSLEDLLIATLRAYDDDDNLQTPGPHHASIVRAFADRGVIDRWYQSDQSFIVLLDEKPLAPLELTIFDEEDGEDFHLYSDVSINSGIAAITAIFNDNRDYIQAKSLEIQVSESENFTNPIYTQVSSLQDEIFTGTRINPVSLAGFEMEEGMYYYLRIRFIDENNDAGWWSAPQGFHQFPWRYSLNSTFPEVEDMSAHWSDPNRIVASTSTGAVILDVLGNTLDQVNLTQLEYSPQNISAANKRMYITNTIGDGVLAIDTDQNLAYRYNHNAVYRWFAEVPVENKYVWDVSGLWVTLTDYGKGFQGSVQDVQHIEIGNKKGPVVLSDQGIYFFNEQSGKTIRILQKEHSTSEIQYNSMTVSSEGYLYAVITRSNGKFVMVYDLQNINESEVNFGGKASHYYCESQCVSSPEYSILEDTEDLWIIEGASSESERLFYLVYPQGIQEVFESKVDSTTRLGEQIILPAHTTITNVSPQRISVQNTTYLIVYDSEGHILFVNEDNNRIVGALHHEDWSGPLNIIGLEQGYIVAFDGENIAVWSNSQDILHNASGNGGIGNNTTASEENSEDSVITEDEEGEIPVDEEEVELTEEEKSFTDSVKESGFTIWSNYKNFSLNAVEERSDEIAVTLQWDPIVKAYGRYGIYRIYRSQTDAEVKPDEADLIGELESNQEEFSEIIERESGTYFYRIYAMNGNHVIGVSDVVKILSSSIPNGPRMVTPRDKSFVLAKPLIQAKIDTTPAQEYQYELQISKNEDFSDLEIHYLSELTSENTELNFKIGDESVQGAFISGETITRLSPGFYSVRSRVLLRDGQEGKWSAPITFIIDDFQFTVQESDPIYFDASLYGENVIFSGSTLVRAQTYAPNINLKLFTDTPLANQDEDIAPIKDWDGQEGFGFAFRWSFDGGETWKYKGGDSEVEWERIPENLTYHPFGRKLTPTLLSLQSQQNNKSLQNFVLELKLRVTNTTSELGEYGAVMHIAPMKEMYSLPLVLPE